MIIRPAQPIATTTKSSTDHRAVFVSVSNESGIVDLLIPQRTERFGQLRCIYIDTSAQDSSGNGCTIETDLGQNVQAPAGTQGYYPVFIPFVSKLTVSSNQTVNLLLLDFDVQPSQWHVANTSSVVPNPLHVIVDDQPLATNATIQNWPASQHVTLDGQPITVNSTIQNWPLSQHVTLDGQPVASNATLQNGTGTLIPSILAGAILSSAGGTPIFPGTVGAKHVTGIYISAVNVSCTGNQIIMQDGANVAFVGWPITTLTNFFDSAYCSVSGLMLPINNISNGCSLFIAGGTITSGIFACHLVCSNT